MKKTTVIYGFSFALIGIIVWSQWPDAPVKTKREVRTATQQASKTTQHHAPQWPEAPTYEALTPEQKSLYIEQKDRAELAIKTTMQEFSDNLGNADIRAQLQQDMQQQARQYKAATLKLAKDALKQANAEKNELAP